MNCGMPQMYSTFMAQMDVPLYQEDLSAINLMSSGAVNAFTFWTDFYINGTCKNTTQRMRNRINRLRKQNASQELQEQVDAAFTA